MKNAADVPAFAPSLRATTSPLPTAGGAPCNAYNAYANPVKKENKSGLIPSGFGLSSAQRAPSQIGRDGAE